MRLELLYGLGPALYLYTKSVTNKGSKLNFKDFLILLPAFLELIYYRTSYYRGGAIQFSAENKTILQQIFIIQQWTGFVYSTIFMFLSVYKLYKYNKWLHSYNFV